MALPVVSVRGEKLRTRWRWWYEGLADWMLANPGGTVNDAAAYFKKHRNTIGAIMNSDMFRNYFNERQEQFRAQHDTIITGKAMKVAEASMDIILEVLEKKRDKIPLSQVSEIQTNALAILGYGAKQAGLQVNVNNNSGQQVFTSVSAEELNQARAAIRKVEAAKVITTQALAPPQPSVQVELLQSPPLVTTIDHEDQ